MGIEVHQSRPGISDVVINVPCGANGVLTGTFPIDLDPVQIQRDADLMLRYGQLSSPFNVKQITGP